MSEKPLRELILLVGMPGAGKSTYLEEHGEEYFDYTKLCPEDEAKEIFQQEAGVQTDKMHDVTLEQFIRGQGQLEDKLKKALAGGENIIIDSANMSKAKRTERITAARNIEGFDYKVKAVVIHAPEEDTHVERLVRRGIYERGLAPLNGIEALGKTFEMPSQDEGIDKIVEIGTKPKKPYMHAYREDCKGREI